MRLFTARPRRSDRPPEVRSLDLAAFAASRGGTVESADAVAASVARVLTGASGLEFVARPFAAAAEFRETELEAIVSVASRRLRILVDRETRRLWLGAVLGLPEGHPQEIELAADPTPLERAVLARTLVEPVAEAWLASGRALGVSDAPVRMSVEFTAGSPETTPMADLGAFTASVGAGRAVVRIGVSAGPIESGDVGPLDRAIRSASLPWVVTLDPSRTGLCLRAADLVRLEPGDVLVTDLSPGPSGSLPVEVGARSARSEGPSGPVSRASILRKGRLGTVGALRGVRFESDGR